MKNQSTRKALAMPQIKSLIFLFAALILTLTGFRATAQDSDLEGYAKSQIGVISPLKPAAIAITTSNEALAEQQNAAKKTEDPNDLYSTGSSTMSCDPNCAECMKKAICANVGRQDTMIDVNLSSGDSSTRTKPASAHTTDQK